jgi:(p)ppGpp synthase/HD superfamily hydrolase
MKRQYILSRAIMLATQAHEGQFDRGGVPYILHPLAVMHLTHSQDEEIKAIAVLHDAVEDSDLTIKDLIDEGFTNRIVRGVYALTKREGQTYEQYKLEVFSNRDAMIVKKADLTHNSDINRLKGVRQKDLDRIKQYHEFYLEIVKRLETT